MKLDRKKWMATALGMLMLTSVNAADQEKEYSGTHKQGQKQDESGGYAYVDFIYWACHEGGLDYQIDDNGAATMAISSITDDKSAKPGFRVGLGMHTGHDSWQAYANYTWLWFDSDRNQIEATTPTVGDSSLWATAFGTAAGNFTAGGAATWQMKLNDFYVSLKRNIYQHARTTFAGELGLQGNITEQTVMVKEGAAANITQAVQKFSSVGWRAGTDFTWGFSDEFSFFADVAGSLLYGKWDDKRYFHATNPTPKDADANIIGQQESYGVQPIFDQTAGFRYQSAYDEDYGFLVQVGWENQVWINHFKMVSDPNVEPLHTGSLDFMGLALRAQFNW